MTNPQSCFTCGGRGVVDAHEMGDCNGGPCRHCNGTGIEKVSVPKIKSLTLSQTYLVEARKQMCCASNELANYLCFKKKDVRVQEALDELHKLYQRMTAICKDRKVPEEWLTK